METPYGQMPDIKLPKLNLSKILLIAAAVIVLAGLTSSFYTVAPDEVAVIQRFGKFIGTADQGLHFKLPYGLDKVTNVKTTTVRQLEFGFRTARAGVQSQFITEGGDLEMERLVLSGDLNVVALEWVMQYVVADPYKYLFNVKDVEGTLRVVSEAAVKEVVGDYAVDDVITTEREEIGAKSKIKIQEILDSYECGISIVDLRLRNVNPPTREVQNAFEAVNQAEQKKEELIRLAEADYNATVPRERGLAQQSIDQAEGTKQARINVANGEAEQFLSILAEYSKARDVTRARLYLETLSKVLPASGRIIVIDESLDGIVPLLNIQKDILGGGSK
jgi:membrane protease subunit HflK